jgi:uncharacterized membrane protein
MARERDQVERLTFFSDAVFAIAMTLLVIEIHVPHLEAVTDRALVDALAALTPNFVGFVISFLVIARFWTGHHRLFGIIQRVSPATVRANLGLLMAIAFMPFPTAVLSDYASLRAAVAFYTGFLIVVGFANMHMIRVALRDGLPMDDAAARGLRVSMWSPVAIGAAGLAVGLIAPGLGLLVLILVAPLILLILGGLARRSAAAGGTVTA